MRIELGSGARPTPGFLHQDIHDHGVSRHFTCQPWELPIEPGTVRLAIAVAVVEHMRFDEVRKTLTHMRKLLARNGEFRFDVPDMSIWSRYLGDALHGHETPFTLDHIWSTVYGWQRFDGDEHKSGWSRWTIKDATDRAGLTCMFSTPEMFTELGIERRRFTRPEDAHLYVRAFV